MSCMKAEKLVQLDRSLMKQRTEDVARRDISVGADDQISWGVGEMLFEAHVRMLDDMVIHCDVYLWKRGVADLL